MSLEFLLHWIYSSSGESGGTAFRFEKIIGEDKLRETLIKKYDEIFEKLKSTNPTRYTFYTEHDSPKSVAMLSKYPTTKEFSEEKDLENFLLIINECMFGGPAEDAGETFLIAHVIRGNNLHVF